MARGQTIFDRRFGSPPGADALIKLWNDTLVTKLLRIVWEAYDRLQEEFLDHIPWDEDYDDLERSISEELERMIQGAMEGFLPFRIQHGPFERESRAAAPAQPPQYDIAFVSNGDPRLMWPLEAKVLKTDADTHLDDYIKTLNTRYLTCKYAPFSNGGAMLCYLKAGTPVKVLLNIESRIGSQLIPHPAFATREHRTSDHIRAVPQGKDYPFRFRCHHLILLLEAS